MGPLYKTKNIYPMSNIITMNNESTLAVFYELEQNPSKRTFTFLDTVNGQPIFVPIPGPDMSSIDTSTLADLIKYNLPNCVKALYHDYIISYNDIEICREAFQYACCNGFLEIVQFLYPLWFNMINASDNEEYPSFSTLMDLNRIEMVKCVYEHSKYINNRQYLHEMACEKNIKELIDYFAPRINQ